MKTIEEIKRLSEKIEKEQRKIMACELYIEDYNRAIVREIFSTSGYKALIVYRDYEDFSLEKFSNQMVLESSSDSIRFFDILGNCVMSISLTSSLEEQIKKASEEEEQQRKKEEDELRERELKELKRLKEKYEDK